VLADAAPAQIEADAQVMDMVVGRRHSSSAPQPPGAPQSPGAPHPTLSPEGRGNADPSPPPGERAG
jgi:hypothetical protein